MSGSTGSSRRHGFCNGGDNSRASVTSAVVTGVVAAAAVAIKVVIIGVFMRLSHCLSSLQAFLITYNSYSIIYPQTRIILIIKAPILPICGVRFAAYEHRC